MHSFTHYALTGAILASALGAIVMCLLVIKYGFAPATADSPRAAERFIATRLGHALAAVCFAVVAILSSVALAALARQATPPPVRPDPAVGELRQLVGALGKRLSAAEARQGAAESRVGGMESRVGGVESKVTSTASRVEAVDARVRELGEGLGQTLARLRSVERATAALESARSAAPAARRPVAPDRGRAASASQGRPAVAPRSTPLGDEETAAPLSEPPADSPAASPMSAPLAPVPVLPEPSPSRGGRSSVGDDWKQVRREWRQAKREAGATGEDIRNAFVSFGKKLRDVFAGN